MGNKILFIDDERTPCFLCDIVRNTSEAVELVKSGDYSVLYLDHDLGENESIRGFCLFLEESFFNGEFYGIEKIVLHTQNPVGRKWMRDAFLRYVEVVDGFIAS